MRIGFIGTGVMGGSMAGHLLKAGYALTVFNRTKSKAENLLSAGAKWADTPAEVARNAEVVLTIVGDPADVEAIYLGPEGILAQAEAGTLVVDMTTSSPDLAETLYQKGKEKGIEVLDAPVSGGDSGAREGTLSIMVGGDRNTFDSARQLLEILGPNIVYQGEAGNGQRTKMANQIAIAGGMLGVCEAVIYAQRSGLDPETVLQSIQGGAAGSWSLTHLAPRMLEGDFAPGFFVKHFVKDLKIALESAEKASLDLPALELALQQYEKLMARGDQDKGTQALVGLY
jgi:3-hydroxyisobutyrate dehydrogenase